MLETIDTDFDGRLFSVSEVTATIADLVEGVFDGLPFWVRGEISGFRGANQRGHMYFSLKDDQALLPVACFARQASKLDVDIKEGMAVIASGRLNVYPPHGRYQFIVESVIPEGAGKLFVQLEKLKKKLSAEGLFEEEHKFELPDMPSTIGVVTSPTGAVIRDIQSVLKKRYPIAKLILSPAKVQGDGADTDMIAALERLEHIEDPPDVIIIGRGGGSIEDLWCFNSEALARKLFALEIPVVSAVGHETDFTICDMVADMRAATPTQAAEMVAPDLQTKRRELSKRGEHLVAIMASQFERAKQVFTQFKRSSAIRSPEKWVIDRRQMLETTLERMTNRMDQKFSRLQSRLLGPKEKLSALNPKKVLSRGYCFIEKGDAVISSTKHLKAGDSVRLHLGDGQALSTIDQVQQHD